MNNTYDPSVDLPKFCDIDPKRIESQLVEKISYILHAIKGLISPGKHYTWENFIEPSEEFNDQFHLFWSPINQLYAVRNTPDLRHCYNECLPKISDFQTELSHDLQLYEATKSIVESEEYKSFNQAQKMVLSLTIRDFQLNGVTLPDKKKEQFSECVKKLSALRSTFDENVLDASQAWTKHITDKELLKGLPHHALISLHQEALFKNLSGWLITLSQHSYTAISTYAESRDLRKEVYYAYTTRASDQAPNADKWDNLPVMYEILKHRQFISQILGYKNFAERSLATKMLKDPDEVMYFLNKLLLKALPKAKNEYAELKDYAAYSLGIHDLQAWDIAYASEKLRSAEFAISPEEIRPYFPLPKVIDGLFKIVEKLFNIQITQVYNVDVWDPCVTVYALSDPKGNKISYFYFDLYTRENKRAGAWMDEARVRRRLIDGRIQLPIAFLNCNFDKQVGDTPACLLHEDVVTLFHEFGHGLQHMLTEIDYASVSGINGIPWDAVEIVSQFFEHYAWEKEGIALISGHFQTGEPLPEKYYRRLLEAKRFHSGLLTIRQLEFAMFDMKLHTMFDPEQPPSQIHQILQEVRDSVSVIPTPKFNRFENSFTHIFAGGYAAAYYSYKWAEMLGCDAFEKFSENGLFDPQTSRLFRETFLAKGGSVDPLKLFIEFRGREPQLDALLEHSGIE